MMLIAIGIYKESSLSNSPKKSYLKLQAAPLCKTGLHEFNALANFETHTLLNMEQFNCMYFNAININDRSEFHYLKKLADNTIIVIVSKNKLDCNETRNELFFLLHNIEQVYLRSEKINTTLQDILDNPMAYTRHDVLIDSIEKKLLETKDAALKALDAMLERGNSIEKLKYDTEKLARETRSFHIETKNLNRGCCW